MEQLHTVFSILSAWVPGSQQDAYAYEFPLGFLIKNMYIPGIIDPCTACDPPQSSQNSSVLYYSPSGLTHIIIMSCTPRINLHYVHISDITYTLYTHTNYITTHYIHIT